MLLSNGGSGILYIVSGPLAVVGQGISLPAGSSPFLLTFRDMATLLTQSWSVVSTLVGGVNLSVHEVYYDPRNNQV